MISKMVHFSHILAYMDHTINLISAWYRSHFKSIYNIDQFSGKVTFSGEALDSAIYNQVCALEIIHILENKT